MNLREGIDDMLKTLELLQSPSDDKQNHLVTWRGKQYPCTIGTERRGELLQVGGIVMQVQLTAYIRKSLFPTIRATDTDELTADSDQVTVDADEIDPRPNKNIELTSRSRTYLIGQVRLDGSESHFALDLVDPYAP